jgi:hypothetical protein
MIDQMKVELSKAKQELKDYEKECDRLNAIAMTVQQEIILGKIEKVKREIEGMEYTINLVEC